MTWRRKLSAGTAVAAKPGMTCYKVCQAVKHFLYISADHYTLFKMFYVISPAKSRHFIVYNLAATRLIIKKLFQQPLRHLIVRSRQVSSPWIWVLKLPHSFEMRLVDQQQCCRNACQISEWLENTQNIDNRAFEILWDLSVRFQALRNMAHGTWSQNTQSH